MIKPLIETIGILIVITIGVTSGLKISRLPDKRWLAGFVVPSLIPLILLFMVAATRRFPVLSFQPPFSWILIGRSDFVILSLVVPMMIGTLLPRLPTKRLKVLLSIMLAVACLHFSILPFLSPAFIYKKLLKFETTFIDKDVCVQSNNYSCGPASAVTALKYLGIDADEGLIAVAAGTTPALGTRGDMLAKALEKLYGDEGIRCNHRYFRSIDQMRDLEPVIATIKYSTFIDHYVTVLAIDNNIVTIGDPLMGLRKLNYDEFKDIWRSTGVVVMLEKNIPGKTDRVKN